MSVEKVVYGVLVGAGSGAVAAGLGYLKTAKEDGSLENFDGQKFLKTVIIGAVVGGATAEVTGLTVVKLEEFGLMTVIVYFADTLAKAIYRRLLGLKRALSK